MTVEIQTTRVHFAGFPLAEASKGITGMGPNSVAYRAGIFGGALVEGVAEMRTYKTQPWDQQAAAAEA
eukprot:4286150-Pyramimonas_sp.AAC.1